MFSGIRLASVWVNPNFRGTATWGDDVKALVRISTVLAAGVMLCPEVGMAQQPRVAAATVNAAHTRAWTARASGNSQMRAKPGRQRAVIERPVEGPMNIKAEPPGRSGIKHDEGVESRAVNDEAAMLRPTWDSGFWILPPGGLVRFLVPSRAIINVETAPVQESVFESCPQH